MGPFFRLICLLYSIIKILESYKIEDEVICRFVYMILVKQGECWLRACILIRNFDQWGGCDQVL
jgi:hypothetical protein